MKAVVLGKPSGINVEEIFKIYLRYMVVVDDQTRVHVH
jgi:hypothetical protein